MGYYDDRKNVEEYVKMAESYDGQELIDVLHRYLPDGASVLELGMGPGKDYPLLSQHFQVTGSDYSTVFLDRFREQHPSADLIQLDAVTLATDRIFDCLYSNKVLHHLTRAQLTESFRQQDRLLNSSGLLLHSFWYGDKEESFSGLRFVYYTEETLSRGLLLTNPLEDEYKILEAQRYTEIDDNDSIYLLLRKKT